MHQYEQEAKDARAKVQFHQDMRKQYEHGPKVSNRKSGLPNLNTMPQHCRRLISECTEITNDAEALAKEQRAAAGAAK